MAEDRILTVVRLRPLSEKEISDGARLVAHCPSSENIVMTDPAYFYNSHTGNRDMYERIFRYDHCIHENQPQQDVFTISGKPQLLNCFEGLNCSILAFGQTGSGKTYTMFGENDNSSSNQEEEKLGIIPLLCKQMLSHMEFLLSNEKLFSEQSTTPTVNTEEESRFALTTATLSVSFYEIYNEKVHDLLSDSYDSMCCKVREHPTEGTYVDNLSLFTISSYQEVLSILSLGQQHRSVASTLMNSSSSRSHAIFTIYLEQQFQHFPTNTKTIRKSKISLVDLAGSEKVNMTGVTGDRLVEANNINKSLSTLGDVIKALSENTLTKTLFVPYRNSILTWLLKDSLGGNSKTIMLATINPADYSYNESISTLKYIERAKLISTKAIINETSDSSATIMKLQKSVMKLQSQLEDASELILRQQEQIECSQVLSVDSNELQIERQKQMEIANELEQLKSVLYTKMEEISILEKELENSYFECSVLYRSRDEQVQLISNLTKQVEQLKGMNNQLLHSSEEMLVNYSVQNKEQEDRLLHVTTENVKLVEEQTANQLYVQELYTQLDHFKQLANDKEKLCQVLSQEREVYRMKCVESQQEVSRLKQSGALSEEEVVTTLKCDLINRENEVNQLQIQLSTLRVQMEESKNVIESQVGQIQKFEVANQTLWRLNEEKDAALKQSRDEEMETKIALAVKTDEAYALAAEAATLQRMVEVKEQELKKFKRQVEGASGKGDIVKLNEDNKELRKLNEMLRNQLLKTELALTTAQADANKAFAARTLTFDSEMSSLMNTNEDLASQLLKANNDALAFRSQLNALQSEAENVKSINVVLSVSGDQMKQEIIDNRTQLASLAADISTLRSVIESSNSQLEECVSERNLLRNECVDLQQSLQTFQVAKGSVHNELKVMTEQHEVCVNELAVAQKALTEASRDKKALALAQAEVMSLQSVLAMLRDVNAQVDAELVEKNKSILASTLFVTELKAELATLTLLNESHRQEQGALRAEVAELRSALEKYQEINTYIEREMCKTPDKTLHEAIREALDELVGKKDSLVMARNECTRLRQILTEAERVHGLALLDNNELRLSSSEHNWHKAEEQESYLSQELIQSKLLAAELDYQNEELQMAYRAIERRNNELKLKLAQALVVIDEDLELDESSLEGRIDDDDEEEEEERMGQLRRIQSEPPDELHI